MEADRDRQMVNEVVKKIEAEERAEQEQCLKTRYRPKGGGLPYCPRAGEGNVEPFFRLEPIFVLEPVFPSRQSNTLVGRVTNVNLVR